MNRQLIAVTAGVMALASAVPSFASDPSDDATRLAQAEAASSEASSSGASSADDPAGAIASASGKELPRALQDLGRKEAVSAPSELNRTQDVGPFPRNEVTNRPFVSPNGGEEGYRASVHALQQTLTELQQLQLQIKQAHWNVSGTLFISLHELLQEHYEGVSKYADMIAERMLAIGASSDGRATTIIQTSAIPEFPGGYIDDAEVIRWFTNAYKVVGEEMRGGIKATEDSDPTTSNMLQEVEGVIDKYQWQMRGFVQNTATDPNTGWDINNEKPIDMPAQAPNVKLNTPQQ